MLERLETLLCDANIDLRPAQIESLIGYIELLYKWNMAYNLTSVRTTDQMMIRHILDSLVALPFIPGGRLVDVGSGAGLPGIPMAIVRPDEQFFLLECLGKRIAFLRHVVASLGLKNVEIIEERVEKVRPALGFDGVLSRAFAPLEKMLAICRHLPSPRGKYYAFKGGRVAEELGIVPIGFRVCDLVKLHVPGLSEERYLVIVENVGESHA